MNDEFYSLEMLAMSWQPPRYECPSEEGFSGLFQRARRDYEQLVATLYAIEDENNQ